MIKNLERFKNAAKRYIETDKPALFPPHDIFDIVQRLQEAESVIAHMVNRQHLTFFIEDERHVQTFFKKAQDHLKKYNCQNPPD
jgi:hypothetical protein